MAPTHQLKEFARRFLSRDDWEFLIWARARFGTAAAIAGLARAKCAGGVATVGTPTGGTRIHLRAGTADQSVYDEIFVGREYAIDLGEPRYIVDAGAHIGLASVFLAQCYPRARILAIEPEPTNFAMLERNVKAFPNVLAVHAGLWSRKTRLRIVDPDKGTWGFRVEEDVAQGGMEAIGMEDAMRLLDASHIDVLKIDIEGAEIEVLGDSGSWLRRVGAMIVELHDRYRPGCTAALESALEGYSFERSRSGESVVITGLHRKAS